MPQKLCGVPFSNAFQKPQQYDIMTAKQALYHRRGHPVRKGGSIMKMWQRAAVMTAVSIAVTGIIMSGGFQPMLGGVEAGPAVDDRLNEPLGPGLETQAPEETQDPDEPQGPALGQEKEDKQDV